MRHLFFSISGLRGIVGEGLSPDVIVDYTSAFATLYGPGTYVVARDTRPHSKIYKDIVIATLVAKGASVIDIDIAPTPTLLFTVRDKGAKGGIVVTASHNPIEWNALKFAKLGGILLLSEDLEEFQRYLQRPGGWAKYRELGKVQVYTDALRKHIYSILYSPYVPIEELKSRKLKVAVDAVNGAMSIALPTLLEMMGCEVIKRNCTPDMNFPRNPEPSRENLKELDDMLKQGDVDLALATDPDGDRIIFGTKQKGLLSEEYTFPISAKYLLEMVKAETVVTNFSTSMLIEDVTRAYGVSLNRTKVGEPNVVEKMLHVNAPLGGEGNGGVIFPELNMTRDGLLASAVVVSAIVKKGEEEVFGGFRNYCMLKKKFPRRGFFPKDRIIPFFPKTEPNLEDGIYLRYSNSWIHIRASNTEPIIRAYVESDSEEEAEELMKLAEESLLRSGAI